MRYFKDHRAHTGGGCIIVEATTAVTRDLSKMNADSEFVSRTLQEDDGINKIRFYACVHSTLARFVAQSIKYEEKFVTWQQQIVDWGIYTADLVGDKRLLLQVVDFWREAVISN